MTYQGTVRNGVVVFDNGEPPVEGTVVQVVPVREAQPEGNQPQRRRDDVHVVPASEDRPAPGNPFLDGLLEIAATMEDLPSDLARNHDHYLHGLPKK